MCNKQIKTFDYISEHLSIGNLKLCSGAQDKRDLHSNMHMYIYIYMIYTHSQEI